MARFEHRQMFVSVRREHLAKLPPAPMMALQNPEDRAVVTEERATKRLAIAAPQGFATDDPPHAARRGAPQSDEDRVVQPHDRGRPRPDEIPHGAIVAFDDPMIARDERLDLLAKIGKRRPVLAPVQPVELDVLAAEAFADLASEVSFSGAGASDDDNARMFR